MPSNAIAAAIVSLSLNGRSNSMPGAPDSTGIQITPSPRISLAWSAP
ncbi:hypothetical protein ACOTH1_17175 [Achromobacter ruhlandii]|nr:hypothetical protein [Achromobacter ruhlandii]